MSQQDAFLVGGKVQAPAGYADHVIFLYPDFYERCGTRLCIEMCSGQALTPELDDDPVLTNIGFRAGAGD